MNASVIVGLDSQFMWMNPNTVKITILYEHEKIN